MGSGHPATGRGRGRRGGVQRHGRRESAASTGSGSPSRSSSPTRASRRGRPRLPDAVRRHPGQPGRTGTWPDGLLHPRGGLHPDDQRRPGPALALRAARGRLLRSSSTGSWSATTTAACSSGSRPRHRPLGGRQQRLPRSRSTPPTTPTHHRGDLQLPVGGPDGAGCGAQPVGEWNHYEVRVEGKRIRIYLNGAAGQRLHPLPVPTRCAWPGRRTSGLQNHGNGESVFSRDVQLKELADPENVAPT